jgi:nucleotide-binding universal stress UspA family protein
MNERDDALAIRRILVALDASRHSMAALEAAADLATALEARLDGIFVEDSELIRMASHPMAREVQFPLGTTARLDPARMERQLRAQAGEARRSLERVCAARRIEWSFRTIRGDVVSEVLEAAQEVDLLSLGIASRPLGLRVRTGSTARAAALHASSSVLWSQRGLRITPPVMVIHDGSPNADRALGVGLVLARRAKGYLTIAIVADSPKQAIDVRRRAARQIRGEHPFARYRLLPNGSAGTVIGAVRAERAGMLLLCAPCTPRDDLRRILDQVECPVLLIR